MSKDKLRGASRRDFIKGTFAVGAALGWGPMKVLEVLERGGLAHGATGSKVQNLLVINGSSGAHGYWQSLLPHPDAFATMRYQMSAAMLPMHFLQDGTTGGTGSNLTNTLSNVQNYQSLPAMPDKGIGAWEAGERFKLRSGTNNMAFRGFASGNAGSKALDKAKYGVESVPRDLRADQQFAVYARETPFQKYGLNKTFTMIEGGPTEIHATGAQNHYVDRAKNWSVMAAAAAIQQSVRPAILQAIIAGPMKRVGGTNTADFYNTAPGAPLAAIVDGAGSTDMVNLFASNAVRASGALMNPANAALYEAFYKGMVGVSKSATWPTFNRNNQTVKLGANLVGLNLADQLRPTVEDQQRYGLVGGAPKKFAELRDRLIVAEKAFKLGLTTTMCLSFGYDDPHDLFTPAGVGGVNAATAAAILGNFLDAFMDSIMKVRDPFHPDLTLGDNTVILLVGDCLRSTSNRSGWPDPSLMKQNRTWIMHNGILQTGAYGGERPVAAGSATTEGGLFDPVTGAMIPAASVTPAMLNSYGEMAMAAALYAVTRGDERRVRDFYSGPDYPVLRRVVLT